VEKLLELYESEGLHSFMDTAYGYAALTWSGAGDWDATMYVLQWRLCRLLMGEQKLREIGCRGSGIEGWTKS